jgi:hypothetical protein
MRVMRWQMMAKDKPSSLYRALNQVACHQPMYIEEQKNVK